MKYNINFYSEELKPKRELLTLTNVAIVNAVAIVALLVWFGLLFNQFSQVEKKQITISNELAFAEKELEKELKKLAKHNDVSGLNSKKMELDQQLKAKTALYKAVANNKTEAAINYHQVMQELTQHHHHDVWLKSFKFNRDNVLFDGFATNSSAVTLWMSLLQNTNSFKGREFSHFAISEFDQDTLQFQTATSGDILPDTAPVSVDNKPFANTEMVTADEFLAPSGGN